MFKCLFLFYIIAKLASSNTISYREVGILLIIVASNIIREKYINSIYMTYIEAAIVVFGVTINPYFAVFFSITCYDMVTRKKYAGVLLLLAITYNMLSVNKSIDIMLIMGICSLLSYLNHGYKEKSELLRLSYDKERRNSYELETAKAKLMNAALETAHITEIKERNRIAREIHDNAGHSIAGVLMLLQAANKLKDKNNEKANELLQKSISNLSESLTMLKNTVYNIKPTEEYGINYIKNIIDNFSFCKVEFTYYGDFNKLEAGYIELVATNIKEALTNASKHSNATLVKINLECNDNYLRLQIKDNGNGCTKIKDSLGLSGMKERIKNAGGSISINGENGFMIVCVLPLKKEAGGIFEGSNS